MKRLNWKKLTLIALPILVMFAAAIGVGFIFMNSNSDEQLAAEPSQEALVSFHEGSVEYRNEGEGWYEVNSNNTMLTQGSQVRVIGEGKAVINFEDGSLIRLASDTQVRINTLEEDHIQVLNESGETYSRIIPDESRIYEVVAEDTTYTAQGTAFKNINKPEKKGLEVYHSKVTVEGINTEGELLVEQGNKYYIVDVDNPDQEGKVIEINVDEIVADEFTVWNKKEDENYQEFKENMGVLFDIEPPALKITSPANGIETLESSVSVTGLTELGVKVLINGVEVENVEGNFSYNFTLNEGPNSIKIEAIDEAGNKTVATKTVTKKVPPPPTPIVTSPPPAPVGISLYGTLVDGGISLSWNVSGLDTSDGFKVVWNHTGNPAYGVDNYKYLSNGSQRSYTLPVTEGKNKTYYVKVCKYVSESHTCSAYSNQVVQLVP